MSPASTAPQFPRSVIHVDMDCFYVSVERHLDPTLVGKCVAVGGSPDGRGVVASASYEARKFGVKSAMPMSQALRLCPQLVIVGGTFSRYAGFSQKVYDALAEFTPLVQMASQDEAYLDLTGTGLLWGPPLAAAEAIHTRVIGQTGLPCSLGVASNKLVAKVASSLCKPSALLYIPTGSEEAFFRGLPAGYLPGVGNKSAARLKELGINTLGQLAAADTRRLSQHFGNGVAELQARARGEDQSVIVNDEPAKQVSAEETFERDSADTEFLHGILSNLCEKVAYRMRKDSCRACTMTLKYRYSNFETHTASLTLANPTDDESEMVAVARQLLEEKWSRQPIRLLGIAGSNLLWERRQLDLLEQPVDEKRTRLHSAIDAVRGKHGYGIVRRGSSTGRNEEKNDKRWG
jgi:DNA polymerase-4